MQPLHGNPGASSLHVPALAAMHPDRVAVVLNRNARAVTTRQIRRIEQLHGAADVFLSQSPEHCRQIAATLIERRYGTVLLGGGDGTFVCCLNHLLLASQRTGQPLPRLGVLRLGTGNALGFYLGVEPPTLRGLRAELLRARRPDSLEHELPLLLVDGVLTPFAGTGLDSQILEDYAATTRTLDLLGLGPFLGSPVRYALAVALRSVPRFMLRRLPHVEVINVGGPAYAIGPEGQPDPVPLPRGTVLYRGPCTLAGAATVPCYGFGVRIFPFADIRRDKFHVRCTDASAIETLYNLPGVLRGTYQSPSIRDFLCDAVEIHMEAPVPMQIGGDLLRERRDVMRIELAPRAVRMLCARPPMPLVPSLLPA